MILHTPTPESALFTPERRSFLKTLTCGTVGAAFGLSGCSSGMRTAASLGSGANSAEDTSVAITKGDDRRENILGAMEPFREQIAKDIQGKQVVIKLNCVGQNGHPLMVTPPDAVCAVLDFLAPIYDRQVIIAESPVQNKNPEKTFDVFGYRPLEKEYNAVCVDQNTIPVTYHWILDRNLYPQQIGIIDTFLDPDNYFISVTRLKTHNCAVATLTLKNMVMGSPVKIISKKINEKAKMHANGKNNKSPKMINFNMFLMAHRVRPDFSVLDGFVGVEGNGPADGTPVDHHVALAGPDFVAVDSTGAKMMGIPLSDIGYLTYCADAGLGQGNPSNIKIIGEKPEDCVITYKLHDNIDWQMEWKNDLILQGGA